MTPTAAPTDLDRRDRLAVDRTVLANERTLLAYVRTALGLLGVGAALAHLAGGRTVIALGWGLGLFAPLVLGVGLWRFGRVRAHLVGVVGLLALSACSPQEATDPPLSAVGQTAEEQRVEGAVAAIDSLRSARAASIDPDETVDEETFARVCKPVGARARALADSTGWTVRQAAVRFRNPSNAATPAEAALHERFEADPTLAHLWTDAPGGRLYARRITVEASCAACHGPRDGRPAFVAERYPDDRAYGFAPGDLRGVYTVLVPSEP